MLKKRLIFTLLYSDGSFMLSRNFRLQRVGDARWLKKNYNFSNISFSIDELIILDVTKKERNLDKFCDQLKALNDECFVPIAAGGGIRSEADAERMLHSGADKIVLNSILHDNPSLVPKLCSTYGSQCLIGSVDYKKEGEALVPYIRNGEVKLEMDLKEYLARLDQLPLGEIYLNSIDKDGTGFGYAMDSLDHLPASFSTPLIMAGGAGNYHHLKDGITRAGIDAVATANLLNFVGSGLAEARKHLLEQGVNLAQWDGEAIRELLGYFTPQ